MRDHCNSFIFVVKKKGAALRMWPTSEEALVQPQKGRHPQLIKTRFNRRNQCERAELVLLWRLSWIREYLGEYGRSRHAKWTKLAGARGADKFNFRRTNVDEVCRKKIEVRTNATDSDIIPITFNTSLGPFILHQLSHLLNAVIDSRTFSVVLLVFFPLFQMYLRKSCRIRLLNIRIIPTVVCSIVVR